MMIQLGAAANNFEAASAESLSEREVLDKSRKMTDKPSKSQTTMYSNRHRAVAPRSHEGQWHPGIERLVREGYAFMPGGYVGPGCLYRGLSVDLQTSLTSRQFGISHGAHSLEALEREAQVVFVSQDLSDALSVSRMWEQPESAAILVIDARAFAAAHARGEAAVLAFADPGVVFRYPFFATAIALDWVRAVIVHPRAGGVVDRTDGRTVVLAPPVDRFDRHAIEAACLEIGRLRGYEPAVFSPAFAAPG